MSRLACVTGRFQPVHEQHLDLFEIAAADADHLIVAVTNPDTGARHEESTSAHRHLPESNPFTFFERARLLQAALAGRGLAGRATIVPFDMTHPQTWTEYVPLQARHLVRVYSSWEREKAARLARAGYSVTVLEGDPEAKISATDIRARLYEDVDSWAELVPASVAPVLAELLAAKCEARTTPRMPAMTEPAGSGLPPGYGETQPRLRDDRLPIVLVILDGLGDRPIAELGWRTPAEAAHTPHLDALARRGASGWHLPFGWGRAPTSELAHWAMFGYATVPFPGRAVLEALGGGLDVDPDHAVAHASLRTSRRVGDTLHITGRARPEDAADATELLAGLDPILAEHGMTLTQLGDKGEALLAAPTLRCGHVTDSDPLFENFHPWMQPLPTSPDGAAFATALTAALQAARSYLRASEVNTARRRAGLPALDVLTTKWSGQRGHIPAFVDQVGVPGALVTSTRLYRGLAAALDMSFRHLQPADDLEKDLAARLDTAGELIAGGARFVHVHTKATDEAGHTKQPHAKRDALQAIDRGLAGLTGLAERAIVAVTGDHATPSTHGVMHTADPTPLLVAGPTVRPDAVTEWGELAAAHGWWGQVRAEELLPLLLGHANRPVFLGHRITARPVIALADSPQPMPLPDKPNTP